VFCSFARSPTCLLSAYGLSTLWKSFQNDIRDNSNHNFYSYAQSFTHNISRALFWACEGRSIQKYCVVAGEADKSDGLAFQE